MFSFARLMGGGGGFWACLGDSPPAHAQTAGGLGFAMQFTAKTQVQHIMSHRRSFQGLPVIWDLVHFGPGDFGRILVIPDVDFGRCAVKWDGDFGRCAVNSDAAVNSDGDFERLT